MGTPIWINDAIMYIYALSLLFYFSDFMNASRRAKRIGTGLLVFVWLLQTCLLIMKVLSYEESRSLTAIDYGISFSWLLITISLIINRYFYIDFIVFFVNVIGFAVLALQLYSIPADGNSFDLWQTTRELLYVHISLILCAYATLTIGALLAGMYLFLHNRLKGKKWTKFVRRYPSLDTIERYMDKAVIIGVPLLALSLAVAVLSLIAEGRPMLLLDWKVLTSLAALVMYIIYVYQRALNNSTGPYLARLYVTSYAVLLINLLTNSVSRFH